MKLSVITPVWNRADLTTQFLFSNHRLYQNRDDIEFIIIDNGSTDGTPILLETWAEKGIKVITNPENIGFGPANNQGADEARGEYLLFINNDIVVNGDYLTPLVETLEANPNDLVGAHLLDYDTSWNVFDGQIIQYIAGWCLAMQRKTFFDLGGFDERFVPGDYEDIDICYQATQKGLNLTPVTLPFYHISGQTAERQLDRHTVTINNRKKFAEKWGFNEPITA